ncbi:hypothetical protein BJF85_04260 [Saccharomonospora sp. CUA-673]|nr:hypothetical protein BJF85_04260 [Saccharomonospora sp. CUA-673]
MDGPATEPDLVYAEELAQQVGITHQLGDYLVTEEEIRAFARQWDPLPLHIGDGGHFGSVVASGVHTFAMFQRLAVAAVYSRWAVLAGRGLREMHLPSPVFPGDVLTGAVRVVAVEPPRKNRVRVELEGSLENQRGQTVFTVALDSYVHCRPASEPGRAQVATE